MSRESRVTAGILVILLPTVAFGGTSILTMLIGDPAYAENALRQDLWRAGHAHAGVLLVLSLVTLRYVDDTGLSKPMKRVARHSIPAAAILLPAAFFLSVLSPDATEPNSLIYLAYVGAASLAAGLLILGVGLIRELPAPRVERQSIRNRTVAGGLPFGEDSGSVPSWKSFAPPMIASKTCPVFLTNPATASGAACVSPT